MDDDTDAISAIEAEKREIKALGTRLRDARIYLGYTQDQVAGYLGLLRPSISMIEGGQRKVSVQELQKFCTLYKHSTDYFLGRSAFPGVSARLSGMLEGLDGEDRSELERFAEFLYWSKKRKVEEQKEKDMSK